MTKDELFFFTESKKEIEFTYNNKTYLLSYGTDADGNNYIAFGRLYEQDRFSSFKDFFTYKCRRHN